MINVKKRAVRDGRDIFGGFDDDDDVDRSRCIFKDDDTQALGWIVKGGGYRLLECITVNKLSRSY